MNLSLKTITWNILGCMFLLTAPLASASPASQTETIQGVDEISWKTTGPGVVVRVLPDGTQEYRGEGTPAFHWLEDLLENQIAEEEEALRGAATEDLEDLKLHLEILEDDLKNVLLRIAEREMAIGEEAQRDIEASFYDGSCFGSASVDYRSSCGGFGSVSCSSKDNLYISYYASSDVARAGASRMVNGYSLGLGATVSRNLSCFAQALTTSSWGFAMVTSP